MNIYIQIQIIFHSKFMNLGEILGFEIKSSYLGKWRQKKEPSLHGIRKYHNDIFVTSSPEVKDG